MCDELEEYSAVVAEDLARNFPIVGVVNGPTDHLNGKMYRVLRANCVDDFMIYEGDEFWEAEKETILDLLNDEEDDDDDDRDVLESDIRRGGDEMREFRASEIVDEEEDLYGVDLSLLRTSVTEIMVPGADRESDVDAEMDWTPQADYDGKDSRGMSPKSDEDVETIWMPQAYLGGGNSRGMSPEL